MILPWLTWLRDLRWLVLACLTMALGTSAAALAAEAGQASVRYQCVAASALPTPTHWKPLRRNEVIHIFGTDFNHQPICHIVVDHEGQGGEQQDLVLMLGGMHQSSVTASKDDEGHAYRPIWTSPLVTAYRLPARPGTLRLRMEQRVPMAARIWVKWGPASELFPEQQLDDRVRTTSVVVLLITGLIGGLFALALRDRTIGWFAGYGLSTASVWCFLSGFVVLPGGLAFTHPWLTAHLLPFSFGLPLFFGLLLGVDICRLRRVAPRARKAIVGVAWATLAYTACTLVPGLYEPLMDHFNRVGLVAVVLMIVPGVLAVRGGELRGGFLYLAGWLPTIAAWGTMLLTWVSLTQGEGTGFAHLTVQMREAGLLPDWLGSPHARQISLVIENLIFAVALADRALAMRREHEHKLTHDPATRLLNRAGLLGPARRWLGRADRPSSYADAPMVTLALFDILRFGHINQTLGYEAGDVVLRVTGNRLQEQWSGQAKIARVGSNHFVAMVNEAVSRDTVQAFTEHLSMRPVVINGQPLDIAMCAGMVHHQPDGTPLDQLLRRAEVALRVAKRDKQSCIMYQPSMDSHRIFQLSLMSALREAIRHNELQLALQPKVSVTTGRTIGAEALLRWHHPEHGFIPPMEFLPFAEQTGLITEVTHWVMENAMRLSAQWDQRGVDLKLSINISATDLGDASFVTRAAELLQRTGARPQALCIEITESEVMRDPALAMKSLQGLRELGFSLSIDDFGTGNSSLAYLQRMPLQELKVDRSFVREARNNPRASQLMSSIVQMAHQLGLQVVAEGVECQEEWDCVAAAHCDEVQGYMVSRPLPVEQFNAWLEAHPTFLITASVSA